MRTAMSLYVVVMIFNIPSVLLQKNAENFSSDKPPKECGIIDKIFSKCPKRGNEITTPNPETINPVYIPDESAGKNLGFSFSAFVITLFVSLAIALTGAFACWCCRTFCRTGSFSSNLSRVSPPPSTYNHSGVALEPLVREQRRNNRHANSLPSYANVTSSAPVVMPSAPHLPQEDPPPTYDSLFGDRELPNKS